MKRNYLKYIKKSEKTDANISDYSWIRLFMKVQSYPDKSGIQHSDIKYPS
jgi:hypothetical protein